MLQTKNIKFRQCLLVLCVGLFLSGCVQTGPDQTRLDYSDKNIMIDNEQTKNNLMQLTSSNFSPNSSMPAEFTCDGRNISPELKIDGVPAEAQSLSLIVDDPDAPAGDWVHWLVWNIDPQIKTIASGQVPPGAVQGLNDFGRQDYGGPCPPSGEHRYQFKLYALDVRLDLSEQTKKAGLEAAMRGHILEEAEIVGLYKRK